MALTKAKVQRSGKLPNNLMLKYFTSDRRTTAPSPPRSQVLRGSGSSSAGSAGSENNVVEAQPVPSSPEPEEGGKKGQGK